MIKVPILSSLNGEQISEQELDQSIFGLPYRPDILKCVIDWQLAKRRAGTHSTRTIAHVSGTKAKPYKQKGTGRARHGSLRAPQFRGGAVIFGPVLRSHAYALNKKIRKKALQTALSYKISFGKLFIIDDLLQISAKTRDLNNILCKICSKSILMVDSIVSDALRLSSSNLRNVDVLPVIGLNTYDVMRHSCVIINKNALKALEDRLL